LKQPEEILKPLMIAEMVPKDLDPTEEEIKVSIMGESCLALQNPDIESEAGEVVFEVFESDSNELVATAWVDKKTVKLNQLEAAESQGGFVGKWHYEPIDESIFSTKVPKGYELELGRYISGIVTDANLNPVTDANVYVTGLFEGPEQEIITQTNKEGIFEYELKFERDYWGIEFPVVIRAVSPSYPDMAAWTCILDPDVEVEEWPEWMPPIDPEVIVTKLILRSKKVICKSIQALWVQLEEAGSISGTVVNKQGEPIQGAVVNANMHLLFQVNKTKTGRVFTNRFSMSDKTDENGYYRIIGIPSLQGHASLGRNSMKSCSVYASANGYFQKSHYIRNANNAGNTDVTFTEGKYCDFVLSKSGLIIKGRVIDNYGNPLAHYKGVHYMEKGSRSWISSRRLDGEGRFVIHNAPRADVIVLKKETIDDSYDWLRDKETKNLEFLPYAEKRFEFNVPADVNVLDVGDLVMDYPDITAEIYVVDFEGNPVGFVEFAFEQMGNKELLKDRYWKVTDEKEGKCIIENLPRAESGGKTRAFRPISLRPSEKAPKEYRKILERFAKLTYYHLKYPGDYKHYIFKLVLPRNDHRQDYRMQVYSPEGELLLEED
jgi:protocatechuate 3,4-dioxygenase beta subunit